LRLEGGVEFIRLRALSSKISKTLTAMEKYGLTHHAPVLKRHKYTVGRPRVETILTEVVIVNKHPVYGTRVAHNRTSISHTHPIRIVVVAGTPFGVNI